MMGCLFGNVVATSFVGVVPVAGEDFAQNWIQRFLDSSGGLG